MLRCLLPLLICPSCLPSENSLHPEINRMQGEELVEGGLFCPQCQMRYPVENGVAVLLPSRDEETNGLEENDRYEQEEMLGTYLWGHYADLWGDPDASAAYQQWASLLDGRGPALDLGCAVGRMTLELGRGAELAIGIDRSQSFIRTARRLARERQAAFSLVEEGRYNETCSLTLPPWLHAPQVEFLVADALALPFAGETFARVASLNLLDKVPDPRRHLAEVDRVAGRYQARLLVSDPFSWSSQCTPEEKWLGGSDCALYPGRGIDNLTAILTGESFPPWSVQRRGTIDWALRRHANLFERIRSQFVLAARH